MRTQVRFLASLTGIAVSCCVGDRCGSDLVLPWLWCRPAATAPSQPLAWERPQAVGVAPKDQKKTPTNKQTNNPELSLLFSQWFAFASLILISAFGTESESAGLLWCLSADAPNPFISVLNHGDSPWRHFNENEIPPMWYQKGGQLQ